MVNVGGAIVFEFGGSDGGAVVFEVKVSEYVAHKFEHDYEGVFKSKIEPVGKILRLYIKAQIREEEMVTIKQAYKDIVTNYSEYFPDMRVEEGETDRDITLHFDEKFLPKKYQNSKRFEKALIIYFYHCLMVGMADDLDIDIKTFERLKATLKGFSKP